MSTEEKFDASDDMCKEVTDSNKCSNCVSECHQSQEYEECSDSEEIKEVESQIIQESGEKKSPKSKDIIPQPYPLTSGTIIGIGLSYFDTTLYFETNDLPIKMNDICVVNMEKDEFVGRAHTPIHTVTQENNSHSLVYGKVIRLATQDDMARIERNSVLEKRAFQFCNERAKVRHLKMKLIKVSFRFDTSKAIFFFTANGRIDFRELVKDLAGEFHTRIEMKQIGVRDETKLFGGYGPCGRLLCCRAYLKEFAPVSIRMAKIQQLTLDPEKISGVCGRLMCCLEYEYETYQQIRKKLPKSGEKVIYNNEKGKVINTDILKETVSIECYGGKIFRLKADEVTVIKQKKLSKNEDKNDDNAED